MFHSIFTYVIISSNLFTSSLLQCCFSLSHSIIYETITRNNLIYVLYVHITYNTYIKLLRVIGEKANKIKYKNIFILKLHYIKQFLQSLLYKMWFIKHITLKNRTKIFKNKKHLHPAVNIDLKSPCKILFHIC